MQRRTMWLTGNILTARLESVLVAVARSASGSKGTVAMRNTVLQGYCTDRAGIGFRVQIPSVVYIMVRYAIPENIAVAAGKFGGKTIGIFVIGIFIVVRFAPQNKVIGRPLANGCVRRVIPAQLQTGIGIAPEYTALDSSIVVTREQ